MLDWLQGAGAGLADLAVDDGAAERGLVARAALDASAIIAEIPRRLLITSELARASALGAAIAETGIDVGDTTYLAAFLLEERDSLVSPWAHYLDGLPAAYPQLPLFWEPARLAPLRGATVLARLERRRVGIAAVYEALRTRVTRFARFSLEDLRWAHATVTSRGCSLRIDGRWTRALIPLVDLMSHAATPEADWVFDDARDAVVVRARRAFAAGDEIRDHRGDRCNGSLWLDHGFALADNDANTVELSFRIAGDDPHRGAKLACFGIDGGADPVFRFRVSARTGDDSARRMFNLLRIACATGDEVGARAGVINARNEARVLDQLVAACDAALGRYACSLDEDEARLAAGDDPVRWVTRGEKRVLMRYRDAASSLVS